MINNQLPQGGVPQNGSNFNHPQSFDNINNSNQRQQQQQQYPGSIPSQSINTQPAITQQNLISNPNLNQPQDIEMAKIPVQQQSDPMVSNQMPFQNPHRSAPLQQNQQQSSFQPSKPQNISVNINYIPNQQPINQQSPHQQPSPFTFSQGDQNQLLMQQGSNQNAFRDPTSEFVFSQYGWGQRIIRVEAYNSFVKVENEKTFIRSQEYTKNDKDIIFLNHHKQEILKIQHRKGKMYDVYAKKWDDLDKSGELHHLGSIKTNGGSVQVYNKHGEKKQKFSEKGKAIKECLFDCTLCLCCLGLSCPFSCLGQLCCLGCLGKGMLKNRYNLSITKPKYQGIRKMMGVAKYRTFDLPHESDAASRVIHEDEKNYHSLAGGFNEEEDLNYRKQNLDDGMDHCCYKARYYPRYDLTIRKHFTEEYGLLLTAGTILKAKFNVYSTQRISWAACFCCCLFGEAMRQAGVGGPVPDANSCCRLCKWTSNVKQCLCCRCSSPGGAGSGIPLTDSGCCSFCSSCSIDFKCDFCDILWCDSNCLGLFDCGSGGNDTFCEACCGKIGDLDAPNPEIDLGCCENVCGIVPNCDCDCHHDCCCQGIDCDNVGEFFGNCCDVDKCGDICKECFECDCGDCCDKFKDCCQLDCIGNFCGDICKECDCSNCLDSCKDCDLSCACDCVKGVVDGVGDILK